MNNMIATQIKIYLDSLPERKRLEMEQLHSRIMALNPTAQLWFLDGKNSEGKVVTNPNIGYGLHVMKYASGETKDFYQVGISANTGGISVYIMSIADKNYLSNTYVAKMGKATITGYCIKFKQLGDIHLSILEEAIKDGFNH